MIPNRACQKDVFMTEHTNRMLKIHVLFFEKYIYKFLSNTRVLNIYNEVLILLNEKRICAA